MFDPEPGLHRAESDWMDPLDPNPRHDLAVRMAELARAIAAPRTLEHLLTDVTAAALELIPGADVAGVPLVKKGGDFESLADTAGLAAQLDKLQHDFREGPCAEAALQETIVRSDDLRSEARWPRYARQLCSSECSVACRSSCTPQTARPAR
jgi:hypothetical protein